MRRPRVLMVTGVYHPETSGASLQCRQLISALKADVDFEVLTTSAHRSLPTRDVVDGVSVTRIFVDPSRPATKAAALMHMTPRFARAARGADVVHVHGFSQKNVLLAVLGRLLRKKLVMKLTSAGHDDAVTMRARGGVQFWCYRGVDRAIAVSPKLRDAWVEAGLDPAHIVLIPNAVDTERFRPASAADRAVLRKGFGWNDDIPVVLFVGFFSQEKRPDALYRAWAQLWAEGGRSTLVLVGATRSSYFEIDPAMADAIRDDARRRDLSTHLHFVERADDIEQYYRAADVFELPTTREGLPNVLLEAMASGVPPVISRLQGVTDWIVEDRINGRRLPPADDRALTSALRDLLESAGTRERLGAAARAHVERHFTPAASAASTLAVYRDLIGGRQSMAASHLRKDHA